MIDLTYNIQDDIIYTNWILKISQDRKKHTRSDGTQKEYFSFFTTLPQELYTFLEVKNDMVYMVNDPILNKLVLTSKEPNMPVSYVSIKLTQRGKKNSKKDSIPTTSFTIPKKLFPNREKAKKIKYTLCSKKHDKFRDKKGVIIIELLYD